MGPGGYVDLHLHLLPGLDDGARDLGAALEHAARMAEAGVTEAVCTPHVGAPGLDVEPGEVAERTAQLQAELDAAGIPLCLHPGGELHPARAAQWTAAELDRIAQGPAGRRWVLLEVPFAGVDREFVEVCRAVSAKGPGLPIAHPERAAGFLRGGSALVRPLLAAGAVLQVNVDSLQGRHGPEAQEGAERLLRGRAAYVLASDGHPGTRDQTLADGFGLALAAGIPWAQAWRLTSANPRLLVTSGLPSVRRAYAAAARA